MIESPNFFAGSIDFSVHEFLNELSEIPSGMSFALITCIDSNPDLPKLLEISPELRPIATRGRIVGSALLISTKRLLAADRSRRIFFGFDEVFFFHDRPDASPPSPGLLTSPELGQDSCQTISSWMQRHGSTLAIGDGVELKYIVRLSGVARLIITKLSNRSPTH
jgi:hypothetical protein